MKRIGNANLEVVLIRKKNTAISTPKTQMSSHDSFVNPITLFLSIRKLSESRLRNGKIQMRKGLAVGWIWRLKQKPFVHSGYTLCRPVSEHKTYGFFSYKDDQVINKEDYKNRSFTAPVIPGSEIRGMLRSAFEAVTNSCFSTTDNELLLSKRSSAPLNEYGLLVYEDKEWALFSAEYHKVYESHLGPKFHVHQNKVVWFKEGDSKPLSFEQRPGYREGVLHLTPLGVRSNSQRVFFNLNRKLKGEASDLGL